MNDQNARFFIVRAPSEEFFTMALKKNQWAISQKCADRLLSTLEKAKEDEKVSIVVFVSIANSNGIQGAFKFTQFELEPASEEWLRVYPGPQKYMVNSI